MTKQTNEPDRHLYTILRGNHNRYEGGVVKHYAKGEKIALTDAEAKRFTPGRLERVASTAVEVVADGVSDDGANVIPADSDKVDTASAPGTANPKSSPPIATATPTPTEEADEDGASADDDSTAKARADSEAALARVREKQAARTKAK